MNGPLRQWRNVLHRIPRIACEAEAVNVYAEHEEARDGRCGDRRDPEEHPEERDECHPSPASAGLGALHAASGSAVVTSTLPMPWSRTTMAPRRARKALTTSGSNCKPAPLRMTVAAASNPRRFR